MSERFYLETPVERDRALLVGAEAHHLIHVMRLKAGARVILFDGGNEELLAEVRRVGRTEVELAVLSHSVVDRELPQQLVVGVALPKGDRQKWLVEKGTELGISRIVPLRTVRGVAQPVDQALARLRRAVVEASKQCGRNRLLEIVEPQSWEEFVTSACPTAVRLVAHPKSQAPTAIAATAATLKPLFVRPAPVYLAIGPEGGFADDEIHLAAKSGWTPVDLGARILRVETAVVMLASLAIGQLSHA